MQDLFNKSAELRKDIADIIGQSDGTLIDIWAEDLVRQTNQSNLLKEAGSK